MEVDHERLQLLRNDPRLVFHVPAVKRTSPSHEMLFYQVAVEAVTLKNCDFRGDSYPINNPKSRFLP